MCGVAFVAAPTLLVLAAFTSANVVATGEVVPYVTSGGFNLWLGNHPDADGVNPFISGPREGVVRVLTAQATDAVEADRLYRRALTIFERSFGADHTKAVACRENYAALGRTDRAGAAPSGEPVRAERRA